MKKGIVKWFNNAKGYGFILSDDDAQDIFAHYSSIDMNGYRTLRTGQPVFFEAIAGPKGLHATAIKLLSEEEINAANYATSSASATAQDNGNHFYNQQSA